MSSSSLKKWVWKALRVEVLKFLYVQRVKGFDVPTAPHFDSDETVEWFTSRLLQSKYYVEFGSGGSTFIAAQNGLRFVAVDSDRFFLQAVRNKIEAHGFLDESRQTFHYANIGLTKGWGRPIVDHPRTEARLTSFRAYSDFPAEVGDEYPDLVLVDGRFRVACALKAVRALRGRSDWTLVIDDYTMRPDYKVVERFAKLEKMVGRMAVFNGCPDFEDAELERLIEQFELDSR